MRFLRPFCLIMLVACCSQQDQRMVLTIGTAANMQYAMKEITAAFTEKTGIPCEIVVSSSGKLTAQIQQGAPLDILVSADLKYPMQLYQKGLLEEQPKIYAYGRLIMWTQDPELNLQLMNLTEGQITRIAMANPETAPYGQAAMEYLQNKDLWIQLQPKLVYGESIGQTNQFILSQAVVVGLTSQSVIMAPGLSDKGRWHYLDTSHYQPIAQSMAIISSPSQMQDRALDFQKFLFSPQGQEILERYGYLLP